MMPVPQRFIPLTGDTIAKIVREIQKKPEWQKRKTETQRKTLNGAKKR
jgi:hypothetical protein